ncbi:MAG TPA: DUF456 family protein [Steroidobacteraceae bacterium]|nr:DUF456 family protein [Steroidobacteraceae bacterium]
MNPIGWWLVAALLMLIGVIGSFIPAIPGVIPLFGGMLLAAWIDGFRRIGWVTLTILGTLAGLALLGDVLGGLIGARQVGASRAALLGAAIGGVAGIFFGLAGALLGPFLGALVGELLSRGQLGRAARVGAGTWVGIAFSLVFRLMIVFAMLAVFITRYLL